MLLHKQITINASTQQVFGYWADFRHFQKFVPIIEHIDILDDRRSHWIIHTPMGHKVVFESVITTFEPGKILTWVSHHADGHARGEIRLTESGGSTQVELNFEYNLHRSWMQKVATMVGHFGFPSLAFDHGLKQIKEKIEQDISA